LAVIVDIADAVVNDLNATDFGRPLTAVRSYLPVFDLKAMKTLHITVVPKALSNTALDRSRDTFEYQIDVAVQQKIEPTLAALDDLLTLVEQIGDHLRTQRLLSYPGARCMEVKNDPVYATEHLAEWRQFTSLLTLTYRVVR
jgi:hypothetical protein